MSARLSLGYLFVLAALVLLAGFALLYDLGDRPLWGDEAETALLGIRITEFGVPRATDGRNYVTLLGRGSDTNTDDIWVWSPWLDEYVAAASLGILGRTTTAARLPFALIGLVSVVFLAVTVHRIYREHEPTVIATLLYVTNVAFLLHARQSRYYALVFLAQIGLIYGFHQLVAGRSRSGIVHLSLALVLQFHSNYLLVLPNLAALAVTTLVVRRRYERLVRDQAIALAILAVAAVPWLLYAKPWHQSAQIGLHDIAGRLGYYLFQTHFHVVPLLLLLIPVLAYLRHRGALHTGSSGRAARETQLFLWVLVSAHLLLLAVGPGKYLRYLIPLIPVLVILTSVILVTYVRRRSQRRLLVAALALSNVISVVTAFPVPGRPALHSPFGRHLDEITSSYENKLEQVVRFLRENAGPDQSLLAPDPEFPLIFYTGMRVIDARLLAGRPLDELPDWILAESASAVVAGPEQPLPPSIAGEYETIELTVRDSPPGDSRPDPNVRAPFSSERTTTFKIYRRRGAVPDGGSP
jgi:hypothetical protein